MVKRWRREGARAGLEGLAELQVQGTLYAVGRALAEVLPLIAPPGPGVVNKLSELLDAAAAKASRPIDDAREAWVADTVPIVIEGLRDGLAGDLKREN